MLGLLVALILLALAVRAAAPESPTVAVVLSSLTLRASAPGMLRASVTLKTRIGAKTGIGRDVPRVPDVGPVGL